MKKPVVSLFPRFTSEAVTDGLNGKFTMSISLSEVEPSEDEYLINKIAPEELKKNPDVFQELSKKATGYPNGLWNLAVCYDCGIGTVQNQDLANAHYLMALTQAKFDAGIFTIDTKENALNFLSFTPSYEAYNEAALKGCPYAAYQCGLCFLNGIGIKEDNQTAVLFFTLAASENCADATAALGDCFAHGYGVPQDMEQAFAFYQKAADGGSAEGKYNLGVLHYNNGQEEEGLNLIKEAAELGYSKANEVLKSLNKPTTNETKNNQELHPVVKSMIDASFFPFFSKEQILRFMTHKDESKKIVTLTKAIDYINEGRLFDLQSNDSGTHFAVRIHGSNDNIYESELWFSSDKSQITKYRCTCPSYLQWHSPCKHVVALLEALNKNHRIACAQNPIQTKTEKHDSPLKNVPKSKSKDITINEYSSPFSSSTLSNEKAPKDPNKKLCVTLLTNPRTKAISQNVSYHKVVPSDLEFINKRFTPKQLKEIPDVFKKLSKNHMGHPAALWNLALCYDCGIGTIQSLTLARNFYLKAYIQEIIEEGKYDEKQNDKKQDKHLKSVLKLKAFSDAAKLECSCANYWAGICYSKGYGVVKNPKKANDYFLKASDLGCGDASVILAENYEKGYGVEKNYQKGLRFGWLAYQQGGTMNSIKYYADLVYCTHCGTIYKKERNTCPLCKCEDKIAGIPSEEETKKLQPTKTEIISNIELDLTSSINRNKEQLERISNKPNWLYTLLCLTPLLLITFVNLLCIMLIPGYTKNVPIFVTSVLPCIIGLLIFFCLNKHIKTKLNSKIKIYEGIINECQDHLNELEKFK